MSEGKLWINKMNDSIERRVTRLIYEATSSKIKYVEIIIDRSYEKKMYVKEFKKRGYYLVHFYTTCTPHTNCEYFLYFSPIKPSIFRLCINSLFYPCFFW